MSRESPCRDCGVKRSDYRAWCFDCGARLCDECAPDHPNKCVEANDGRAESP